MFSLQLPIPQALNTSFRSHNNVISKPLLLSTCRPTSSKTNPSPLRYRLAGRQRCANSEIEHETNLTEEMDPEAMPKHVAVIMDGSRRWAKSKGLSVSGGQTAGAKAFLRLYRNCLKYGVKVLTAFAWSDGNWVRPQEEVKFLMDSYEEGLILGSEMLMQHELRLSVIGNRVQLPETFQNQISDVEERTKHNKKMHLVMAVNYGGRSDITEATRKIATKVKDGVLQVEDVDDAVFEQHLGTNVIDEFPNPDLMIRSSGILKVSNFMLWQLAYTEMFFTKKLWPEFDDIDFIEAVTAFQRRQRRFGGHKY